MNMADHILCSSEIDWLIDNGGFILSDSGIDFDQCDSDSEFVNSDEN